jgi:hypothetical protein
LEPRDKFRFNTPAGAVAFAEQLMFIDDKQPRTFVLRVAAREHQRSATFRLSTDEAWAVHLEWLGYASHRRLQTSSVVDEY